jgi:midasin
MATLGVPAGDAGRLHGPLFMQVAQNLVVVNLSNQSDASDLLGGYRPIQASLALVPLAAQFDSLMRETWPQGKNEEFLARVSRYTKRQNWQKVLMAFGAALSKV